MRRLLAALCTFTFALPTLTASAAPTSGEGLRPSEAPSVEIPFEGWAVRRLIRLQISPDTLGHTGAVVLEPMAAMPGAGSCMLPVTAGGLLRVSWHDLSRRPHCQGIFEPKGTTPFLLLTTSGRALARLVLNTPPSSEATLTMFKRPDGGFYWGGVEDKRPTLTADLQGCKPQYAWLEGETGLQRITLGGCPMSNPRLFLPMRDSRAHFEEQPKRAFVKLKAEGREEGGWYAVSVRYQAPRALGNLSPMPPMAKTPPMKVSALAPTPDLTYREPAATATPQPTAKTPTPGQADTCQGWRYRLQGWYAGLERAYIVCIHTDGPASARDEFWACGAADRTEEGACVLTRTLSVGAPVRVGLWSTHGQRPKVVVEGQPWRSRPFTTEARQSTGAEVSAHDVHAFRTSEGRITLIWPQAGDIDERRTLTYPVARRYRGAVRVGAAYSYVPSAKNYLVRDLATGPTLTVDDDHHHADLALGYSWFLRETLERVGL